MSGTESPHVRPATNASATWIHVFPARAEQVRHARKLLALALGDCPMAEEIVLCLSELASNSVLHSASREPGGVVRWGLAEEPQQHTSKGRRSISASCLFICMMQSRLH